jgi:hypothetical protein
MNCCTKSGRLKFGQDLVNFRVDEAGGEFSGLYFFLGEVRQPVVGLGEVNVPV